MASAAAGSSWFGTCSSALPTEFQYTLGKTLPALRGKRMTILCYGEIDLDIYLKLNRLPTMERSASVRDEFDNVGGAAANSAMWLANWGLDTRLAGHDLGDDRAGSQARAALETLPKLDASFVATHAGYRTPRCQCLVTPDGERSFITHWLDEMRMTAPTPAMLNGVSWLNLDMSGPLPMRLLAAQMAKARGIPVLINDIYQADHELLPLVDALVISASVARSKLPGIDPLALARELGARGSCHVIVTDSGAPITVFARGCQPATIQPPSVAALDTTGAGDIFKSGLLYGLLQDLPLLEAVRFGAAAGSLMCQYAGTTMTLAPLEDVRAMRARM